MSLGFTRKGWMYSMAYLNWRRDPNPLIFPLYYRADVNCWACINIKYLNKGMRKTFITKIEAVYAQQIEDELPIFMTYQMLKRFFPPIMDCYRLYKPEYVQSFSIRKINPTVWEDFAVSQPFINPAIDTVININHVNNPGKTTSTADEVRKKRRELSKAHKQLTSTKIRKAFESKTPARKTFESKAFKSKTITSKTFKKKF